MTADNFETVLLGHLNRRPFEVFTIELNTGRRFEVDGPNTVVYRDGFAIYLAPGRIPIYFDHDSVQSVFIAPASTNFASA